MTEQFLTTLLLGYPPDADLTLEIRPLLPVWRELELYPQGDAPWNWRSQHNERRFFQLRYSGAIRGAERHCERVAGHLDTYMGILPRVGRHGGKYDVRFAIWLWSDVDGGEGGVDASIALVKNSGLPAPNLVVGSGNGLHCYWRLTEPVPLQDQSACDGFKAVLQRLVRAIGGAAPNAHADSSRADTASILRLPGTFNLKCEAEPRPVKLLRCRPEAETWSYERWGARLPPEPIVYFPKPNKPVRYDEVRGLPPSVADVFRVPTPEGARHDALRRALCVARKRGFDEAGLMILADAFVSINGSRRSHGEVLVRDTMRRIHPE